MLRYTLFFILVILLFSCKNELELIEEIELPEIPNEIFETNLVGFVTDQNRAYLNDVTLIYEGEQILTDENGLFHFEKSLVSPQGKVVKIEKEGYLPLYKRIYNHRSNETITINAQIKAAPDAITIDANGTKIEEGNTILEISPEVFPTNTSLVYYNHFAGEESIDMDVMIEDVGLFMLNMSQLFYISAGIPFSEVLPKYSTEIKEDEKVYFYDNKNLSWKEIEKNIDRTNNTLEVDIDQYGWWAIGEKLPAHYGTITITQKDNLPIRLSEIVVEHQSSDNALKEILYSSSIGKISKFFPSDTRSNLYAEQEQTSLGQVEIFDRIVSEQSLNIDKEITKQIGGGAYDCNLEKSNGQYAVITKRQHFVGPLNNGNFDVDVLAVEDSVQFVFYDDAYNEIEKHKYLIDDVKSVMPSFVLCENKLTINSVGTELDAFSECNIKINPNETIVIAEGASLESSFLMSFKGEGAGMYDGLVYSGNSTYGNDLDPNVAVDVKVFDELTNRVAGKLSGILKGSGEMYEVLFIGNRE